MKNFYYTIFSVIAITIIIYLGVDIFYQVVEAKLLPKDSDKVTTSNTIYNKRRIAKPLRSFQKIMDRNLFGSTDKNSIIKETPVEIETLEPTSLKIALLGTVAGDQDNAVAVIEDKKKREQDLYRVGESVQDAVLKQILRGKVVLRVGDKDEILTMEEVSSTSSSVSTNKAVNRSQTGSRILERTISIRRSDIEESLQDLNALLSQARILPHFENGEADGLAVTGIKAGSIFMRMGLRNGDIVHGVNGDTIASPDDILSMYGDMQSASNLSIQIKRSGQERTINYRFLE